MAYNNEEFDPQPPPPQHFPISSPYYRATKSSGLSTFPNGVCYQEAKTEHQKSAPDLPDAPPSTARPNTAAKGAHEATSVGSPPKRKVSPTIHEGEDTHGPRQRMKVGSESSDGNDKSNPTFGSQTTPNTTTGAECLSGPQLVNDSDLESVASTSSTSSGAPSTSTGYSELSPKDNQELQSNANTSCFPASGPLVGPSLSPLPPGSLASTHQAVEDQSAAPSASLSADDTGSELSGNDAPPQHLRLPAHAPAPVSLSASAKPTSSALKTLGPLPTDEFWRQEDLKNLQFIIMSCEQRTDKSGIERTWSASPFNSRGRWINNTTFKAEDLILVCARDQSRTKQPDVLFWFPLRILIATSEYTRDALENVLQQKIKGPALLPSGAAYVALWDEMPTMVIRAEAHGVYCTLRALLREQDTLGDIGPRIKTSPRCLVKTSKVLTILGVSETFHESLVPRLLKLSAGYSSPLLLLWDILDWGLTDGTLVDAVTGACSGEDLSKHHLNNLFRGKDPRARETVYKHVLKARKTSKKASEPLPAKFQDNDDRVAVEA